MANQEHLAVARRGVEAIRQWRKRHHDEPMDLSEASLPGADLRGGEFLGTDFRRSILQGADFTAGSARGALFDGAVAQRACFERADISWASFVGANLESADLTRATLEQANMERVVLSDANLAGANLRGANLTSAALERADLEGTDLSGANLLGANLKNARLKGTIFAEANLSGTIISEGSLAKAELGGNPMRGAIIDKPDPNADAAEDAVSAAGRTARAVPIPEMGRARLRIEFNKRISYEDMVELIRALGQLNALVDSASVAADKIAVGLSENTMGAVNEAEKARSGKSPESTDWMVVGMSGRAAACAKECFDAVAAQQKMASTDRDSDANVLSIKTIQLRKHKYENARWRLNCYVALGVSDEDLVRKVEPLIERAVDPLAVLQELAKRMAIGLSTLNYTSPDGTDTQRPAHSEAVEREAEVKRLIAALNSKTWHSRWSAAVALGQLGHDAAAAVPDLIECLNDEKRAVRYTAVCALLNIGPPAACSAVPALVQALKDSDLAVRAEAAKAIKVLQPA